MARKKVTLAWITNDTARRATYNKRKRGLLKKVSELSTLCGVSACAIVYGPYDTQPGIWPSAAEVHSVIARFKSLPEVEQSKKMMNQEGFLRQRIEKLKDQVKKQQKENREFEITHLMNQLLGGRGFTNESMDDLKDLSYVIEEKKKLIQERIDLLTGTATRFVAADNQTSTNNGNGNGNGSGAAAAPVEKTPLEMAMEALQKQPWFMDMMSPNEHLGSGSVVGDNVGVPFGDNSVWSNGFFP